MEHEVSRRQEVAQRDLAHARRAASAESDAIAGELKRLSAQHRETKEMLADRQSEVAQLTELKAQLEGQVSGFYGKLARTEQELCKTQNDLATRAQELADSQSEVSQLAELKAQLEGQVMGTEQELSKTQEELGARSGELDAASNQYTQALMQAHGEIEMLSSALKGTEHELSLLRTKTQNESSQELADSQSEVAKLIRLKAQLEGQIADLDGKLTGTEQGLCNTQVDLAMRS